MDREVVAEKLESLRRYSQRVSEKCPADAEALLNDLDLQDILSLNLSRAVQISVDIAAHLIADLALPAPDSMGQSFECLASAGIIDGDLATRLKKAVGFRNIAVHSYEVINWNIVYAIARSGVADLGEFAKAIDARL